MGIFIEEVSDPEHQIFPTLCYFLYIILIHCFVEVLCTNAMGWILSAVNVVLKTLYNPLMLFHP